jgi:hypothetical protein
MDLLLRPLLDVGLVEKIGRRPGGMRAGERNPASDLRFPQSNPN